MDLQGFLEEINTEKRASISSYISHEAPQYRSLMRYMDEFIDRITPGASGRVLEVEIVAENKGLLPTPDNLGYFGYNPRLSAHVEIISYTKLLKDAKKRNGILFDKLHLPIHST